MIYTLTLNPAVDRELTVKEIKFDTVLRASKWQVDFGGKGFNVSRMLKSLGATSTALGFVGGKSGEILKEGLDSLGILSDFVYVKGETRTNISIVTSDHDHYIKVNEPGASISKAEREALLRKVYDLSHTGDWWVLAGSLPPGLYDDIYSILIKIIQDAGAKVILDTSGEALRNGCLTGPFFVKPNDVEIQFLTKQPVESVQQMITAAQQLLEMGVSNIVVSLGKKGALLVNHNDVWMTESPKIKEKNPIGAGDSLVGGLVWGLSQQMEYQDALKWGVACGSATASLSGTAVGTLDLVQRLVGEVHMYSIKSTR
jgi:1-phosphofructokinase family hexose kinase